MAGLTPPTQRQHDLAELADGLSGPTARVSCPRCGQLAALLVAQRGRVALAWGRRPDGRPAAPSLVPAAATVMAYGCGCGAELRVRMADATEAVRRSAKGRPKRCPATLA